MSHITDRQRYDVIFVGDVASDTYIALSGDRAEVRTEAGLSQLVLPFGAKLAYERSVTVDAGGNAANAAVACARLGLRVALASYLGADQLGRDLLAALHAERVNTSLVRLDQSAPTNRHFVLRLGQERTILVHHEQYDYHWPHLRPSELPAWIYLSSVGQAADAYEGQLADWLDDNPSVELAFQPGTYQIDRGATRLARLYRRSAVLVCNREEAAAIGGASDGDVGSLLSSLLALGPRRVVITDGKSGAYGADGAERYFVPAYPDTQPVLDRTGAGDAFAATVLATLVRGQSLEQALLRAPVNAMSVAHAIGTQSGLLGESALSAYLEDAPAGYGVRSGRSLLESQPALS